MFRLADLDDRLLGECRRRAGLNAGAARDAFAVDESLAGAGGNPAAEAASLDRQCVRALHFLAGADTQRTDNAFGRIIGEIGIGFVLRQPAIVRNCSGLGENVIVALIAITHIAQANGTRHVLQFAIAIGSAGQAIERMVGDIEFHHAFANVLQTLRLGTDNKTFHCGRRAGGRRAVATLDLNQAKSAGTECINHV